MQLEYLDSNNKPIKEFTQWDINRKLKIKGTTISKAPMIHFYNELSSRALVVPSTIVNGEIIVNVPNILLQSSKDLQIAIFVEEANKEGKTVFIKTIPVEYKAKPEDYTFTENIEYANWVELSNKAKQQLEDMQLIINTVNQKLENGEFVGATGNGIDRIEKTNTIGIIDEYTIYYTNGDSFTYQVKNGTGGGGEGGTSDYTALNNLPQINGITLLGNLTTKDLGIEAVNEKLIFTGAVNAEYDGSQKIVVDIPQGGGGDIPKTLGNFKSIYKIQYKGDTIGLSQIELTAEQYPDIKTCKEILVLCSGAKSKSKQVELIINDNLPNKVLFPRLYYANTNSTIGFFSQVTGEWLMDNQRDYATSQTKFMSAGVATSALVVSEIFKACEVNKLTLNYFLGVSEENENLEVLVR